MGFEEGLIEEEEAGSKEEARIRFALLPTRFAVGLEAGLSPDRVLDVNAELGGGRAVGGAEALGCRAGPEEVEAALAANPPGAGACDGAAEF